jgi:ectoine hydroxylase-related dioxygenase (phytanoyl-CoA dioxygenase family)
MGPMTSGASTDWHRDGYVVVRGFLDEHGVRTLHAALEAAPERSSDPNPLTLGTMRFKSNLFYSHAGVRSFVCSDEVVALLAAHLGGDLWARWDQAVWKGPEAPEFPWHQDNGYTGLTAEHFQLWVALTPMNATNGGLVVAPGGHRRVTTHEWIGGHATMAPPDDGVVIDADPGDVVLFSSRLPHMTVPNRTMNTRLAYVVEYLPLGVADMTVEPPHLVVARNGVPEARFEDLRPYWGVG